MKAVPALALVLFAGAAAAQTSVDLGGISADPEEPVEIGADSLSVDRNAGTAVFSGNVVIGQGDLRIAAERVRVIYDDTTGDITRLAMSGGVTLVTANEEAEAEAADYDLGTGELVLTGDVLLTQGDSALSADRMVVNVEDGTARMDGRVRTIFRQDGQ